MSQLREKSRGLHVLTLTPFFPSEENEVSGCFIQEPIQQLQQIGIDASTIAVSPFYYPRKHANSSAPADWIRYPQLPGNFGLSSAGKFLYACLLRRVGEIHTTKPINVIHAHA